MTFFYHSYCNNNNTHHEKLTNIPNIVFPLLYTNVAQFNNNNKIIFGPG